MESGGRRKLDELKIKIESRFFFVTSGGTAIKYCCVTHLYFLYFVHQVKLKRQKSQIKFGQGCCSITFYRMKQSSIRNISSESKSFEMINKDFLVKGCDARPMP